MLRRDRSNTKDVYLGSQLLATQSGVANWIHEDPVTKSKRVTNSAGTVVSTVELDPWGADTPRSSNAAFQPKKFTSYERDANGSDEAMFRRYNRWHSRFDQPDPYDGSYSLTDPQSFNRYSYVQNDPVNFVDPSGLDGEEYGPGDIIHIPAPGRRWSNDPTNGAMLAAVTGSGMRRPNPISENELRFPQHQGSGSPQNPGRNEKEITDCQRFAAFVDMIANNSANARVFLDELARQFTSANNSSTPEMFDNAGGMVLPPPTWQRHVRFWLQTRI